MRVERPRLKANFATEIVDGARVFLLAENRHFLVQGRGPVVVLPYLDGRHAIGEIAQAAGGELSLAQTLAAIRKFDAFGVLAEGRPDLSEPELAYWDALGLDPAAAAAAIAATTICLVAADGAPVQPMLSALAADGFNALACDVDEAIARDDGLIVVLADDYLHPSLDRLDAAFAASGRRWLLAKATGRILWLGPLIQAGQSACLACLTQRLESNRQVEQYIQGKVAGYRPTAPPAHLNAGPAVLAGLLAGELATILVTGESANLSGQMITLDLYALNSAEHIVIRRPQCPRCGDPTLITSRDPKVTVSSVPMLRDADGGLRARPAGEVFALLSPHISPLVGAVTRLSPSEEVENGLTYSYTAGHNFAMVGDNMNLLRRNLRGQSGGKGRTDLQARVSALAEAIERYSGVWRGGEPVRRAPYAELGPDQAVHPDELLQFSASQIEGRHAWNADPANRLQIVTERLGDDVPIDWTAGWSLTRDRVRHVPSAYAWFGHPDLLTHFFCFADSNGNAAGISREEAILHGFCELAERDAVAIWWYNRLRRPAFDLDSLADPYVDKLRDHYTELGRGLWVLDITTDLGIPAFAAVSPRLDHAVQDILVGFGAHLDARIAVVRALTEVNQFLPAVAGRDEAGDAVYAEDDVATLAWWAEATIAEEPWLSPDRDLEPRGSADYQELTTADLAEAVGMCVDRASAAGLEVIVVDQSQPDLDLSVVKVIVPGLRHFWRRLAAGRLYTVPVAMRWLAEPVTEDELNPRNVFF
jgi:oxazoline/thiazoline synthase